MNDHIGRAILEIAVDAAGMNKGIAEIKGQLGGLQSVVGSVGKVLAGAFTVTAIAALGKQVLDLAGDLTDLSKQTGVSTTTLQKWGLAFEQSGVSLESVTKAASELAARVGGGDKSAVKVIEKLGLNIEQIKRMSPEQQFNTVADAVGNIQNKGEQLYASKTLFGRGGVEILKGLTGNLQEATAEFERMGLVMDEETVKTADEFGDKIGLMGTQLMALVATIVGPLLPALSGLLSVLLSLGKVVGDVSSFIMKWLVGSLVAASSAIMKFLAFVLEAATKIPLLGKHLGFAGDAAEWLRQKAKGADEHLVKMFTSTDAVGSSAAAATPQLLGLGGATEKAGKAAKTAADEYKELHDAQQAFVANQATVAGVALQQVPLFRGVLQGGGGGTGVTSRPVDMGAVYGLPGAGMGSEGASQEAGRKAGSALLSGLGSVLQANLSSVIQSAFQGGGNVGASVGGLVGGQLGSFLSAGIGKTLSATLGSTIGGAFGSVIPGLGTLLGGLAGQLIGPLIGKIGGFFKRLFGGPSEQELEGREAAAAFRQGLVAELSGEQTAELQEAIKGVWKGNEIGAATVIKVRDAYIAAGKSAEEALAIVDRLWRAEQEGGDAVAAVIAEIQAVIEQGATPAMEDFGDAAAGAFVKATAGAEMLAAAMAKLQYGPDNNSPTQGGSMDWEPKMFDPVTGSWVTPTHERWQAAGNPGGTEAQFRSAFNLDLISALRAAGISEEQANAWLRDNGGDVSRMGRAFGLPGFAAGGVAMRATAGVFGERNPEMLLPLDRFMARETALQRGLDALRGEMAAIRRDWLDMPRRLMHAALTVRA